MKRRGREKVVNTYCDKCGRNVQKVGNASYGMNGLDFCADHKPWTTKDLRRDYAISEIKKQSFYMNKEM